MEEAQRKAQESAARESKEPDKEQARDPNQKEYEVDFSLKESGQKKAINGYDTREVVMTITVREKGKTLEQSGGIVMTANSWLGPSIREMKEIATFDQKYAARIAGPVVMDQAEQMAAALAMYPGLQQAMARFQAENVNMDGTPILTVVTFDAVKSPEQMSQQSEQEKESTPTSIGGLLGGLGRRAARRKEDDSAAKNRATIFTMNHEVLKISTSVAPADVALPAGFQQK